MAARKANYTTVEKKNFMDIIKKYTTIIDNKQTDGATTRRKNLAWENIARDYNTSPLTSTQATIKQLRRLWMNIKQRQRDALTQERQYRLATGGGPSRQDAEVDPEVDMLLAPSLLVEVDDAVDSDRLFYETVDSMDPAVDTESCRSLTPIPTTPTPTPTPTLTMTPTPITIPTRPTPTPTPTPISTRPTPISRPPALTATTNRQTTNPNQPTNQTPIPTNRQTINSNQPTNQTPIPTNRQTTNSNQPTNQTPIPFQRHKNSILEKEFTERQRRANQLHEVEMEIAYDRKREAKAKADLAELLLRRAQGTPEEE